MNFIIDTLVNYWIHGRRTRTTPSGWISGNAVCCQDIRGRGGFIINNNDAISYSCFNCGFKASWQPGRVLSQKMRYLMQCLNIGQDTILKLSMEALRLNDSVPWTVNNTVPVFGKRALPLNAQLISEFTKIPPKLMTVINYMAQRNLYLEDYPFYWTPEYGYNDRLIIPYYYNNEIVGYTSRTIIPDKKPRYISEQQPGYVFNVDHQTRDRKFVIVCEGPVDAISIDSTAILGSEIKEHHNLLLKFLNKEIILVPDKDHAGIKTVEQAINYGWSVSMPEWPDNVKDINDAVCKLGRLATLWLIVSAKETNELKIKIKAKHWFKDYA